MFFENLNYKIQGNSDLFHVSGAGTQKCEEVEKMLPPIL